MGKNSVLIELIVGKIKYTVDIRAASNHSQFQYFENCMRAKVNSVSALKLH